jgi:hypothetical protein
MTTPTLPLPKLAQQLASMQSELDALRRAYDSRLQELRRRKAELEASLQQVEAEIQVATGGPAPTVVIVAKPASAPSSEKLSLPNTILAIMRERGGSFTVKQLLAELAEREFPTNSSNFPKMVSNRVLELVHKKVLARAKSGKGVVLGSGQRGTPAGSPKKQPPAKPSATTNGTTQPAGNLTLSALLTILLGKQTKPVRASELANQVLAAGYKTKSKEPVNLIWAALAKMDNVVNVKGAGYLLKK